MTVTVAERIVERLAELGIGTLFGVHGANAEDVFDAAVRSPRITPVIAKHEFGAGAMADGHSRIHGGPAAVLTTSGGGALNVVPALGESYDSRAPVLAIIGSAPRAGVGRGGFQDMLDPPDTIDLPAVLSGVVGCCRVVDDPSTLEAAFDDVVEALGLGLPAALIVPKDVQAAQASEPTSMVEPFDSVSSHAPPRAQEPQGEERARVETIAHIADRLRAAANSGARVCFWAGEEASRSGVADTLAALACQVGGEVVVTPGGRDVGAADCVGVTGVMGHPSAHAALAEADLVVAVGCRMSLTDRAGVDDVLRDRTVHLGAHPPRWPGVEHVHTADLPRALDTLLASLRGLPAATPRLARHREYLSPPAAAGPLTMRRAVEIIGAAMPLSSTVFADAGNAGASAIHYLPFGGGRFVVALGMGGMGYGIAAGVGAAIGASSSNLEHPRTVVICGDGSFLMHGMELHTAIEHDAPLTLVVLNNNAHGMCVTRENLYFPKTAGLNRFGDTDIAAGLAAMFPGLTVRRAGDPPSLISACADLMSRPGPNCLVVDVDPDELPPFGPFLKGLP